jgi:hypothetical protein
MIGEKFIVLDVHQATICVAAMDSQSHNPSGVLGGAAWNFVRDLRRRHLGGLALRSVQAA